jgi:hypothetical protein
MSGLPGPGRERVSLHRLWLAYKKIASKSMGKFPVKIGIFVPNLSYLVNWL